MSDRFDNELSSGHDFDPGLHSSGSSIRGQTFSNPSSHSYSPQQSSPRQLRVSSQPLTPTVTAGRRGGCCLFNLGCVVFALIFLVPVGFGFLGSLFEDQAFASQVSEVVSDAVCPNRSTLVFDSDPRPEFLEELQTLRVECVTGSGRVSRDLTEDARNLASLAAVLIGGYIILLVMTTLLRGVGAVVSSAGSALASAPRTGSFAELSSGTPDSLGSTASRTRSAGRVAIPWSSSQRDAALSPMTAQLEKRDRTAQQLDQLKEAYQRGGLSIEDYDRRRKQILEQL